MTSKKVWDDILSLRGGVTKLVFSPMIKKIILALINYLQTIIEQLNEFGENFNYINLRPTKYTDFDTKNGAC